MNSIIATGIVVMYTVAHTAAAAPSFDLVADPTATQPAENSDEHKWSFSLSAYTYFVPFDRVFVQPTIRADHDWLHLEARYNYEDQDTTSVWAGYNLSFTFGEHLTLDITPMIGGVFGRTQGIAPGYELTLAWRRFELYSEAEYLIDTDDTSNSYAYTWTEITYSPLDWLRAGVVLQRTRAYDSDFSLDHGFLLGLTFNHLDLSVYLLDPEHDPTIIVGTAIEF